MKKLELESPLVSASWLLEHLDHPDLIILDATIKKVANDSNENYPEVRIQNARFFDIKTTFSDTTNDIPNMLPSPEAFSEACQNLGISNHHKIVVYDKIGIYSSARVWWMFKIMGHQNIVVLNGGLPAWQQQNLPIEPEINKAEYNSGNFKASFHSKLVVDAKSVLNEIHNDTTLILDARSPGRFTAQEPEPRANLKGGHIPNSINLHYKDLLQEGHMRSVTEIKEILNDFNIENKKLIFTCGSGITACIIMLAAQLAGYNKVSVYDGSWSEWGQLNYVPIEC